MSSTKEEQGNKIFCGLRCKAAEAELWFMPGGL